VYLQGVGRLTKPSGGNLVGPAFTMRNIPAREDLDQISAFDDPNHPQRKGIESVPEGHVLVIDCRGETRVASGGQILTTRLKVRGAAGLVSDGPVRDSGPISQMDFPVYCAGGSAPLNLIHHHAIDLNVPIGCGFPTKPMTIVVPASPGGAIDLLARLIGQKMTESWGQPVTVDNKAGATGIIGTEFVAKAPPDGHVLALVASSHAINPSMVKKLPYDTLKGFEPVAHTHVVPLVLVCRQHRAGQDGAELVAYGKANPGKLSFASSGPGGAPHMRASCSRAWPASTWCTSPTRAARSPIPT
jgi:hypothetical protein